MQKNIDTHTTCIELWEIPEVVDSTTQGLKAGGQYYRPQRVFVVMPQKQQVNQFVAQLEMPVDRPTCLDNVLHQHVTVFAKPLNEVGS